ncbi:MAG: alpha/beta fold hydrolase [Actinomycetota bacterium]
MDTDRRRRIKGWRILAVVAVVFSMLAPAEAEARGGTVIVVLHGGNGNGDNQCAKLDWGDRGFDVICPQGEAGQWNSGWSRSTATRDDVAYLTDLTAGYDDIRVIGYSQGAMMGLRWSCEDPRVKRVLAKSGALPRGVDCPEAGNALVLRWQGANDQIIPWVGDEYVLSIWEERRVRGGCVEVKARVTHLGLQGIVARGCGFHSRVMFGVGHASLMGRPPGWREWAWRWLTREI